MDSEEAFSAVGEAAIAAWIQSDSRFEEAFSSGENGSAPSTGEDAAEALKADSGTTEMAARGVPFFMTISSVDGLHTSTITFFSCTVHSERATRTEAPRSTSHSTNTVTSSPISP
ncbi:hypothetical protein PF004_g13859 [Phytophthora fragariae]|uniref:Uncharacterized protein n=1 Tax=Phytophthora fragariae TaxID=53985 RepID=A0A6G0NQX1_9STRA|nr:hypothetical protein PF004_g13859 [Phytophthora fragariae]